MSERATPADAARAVAAATVLVLVVLLAGANFVLVDVRLLVAEVETRLAWALLVPAVLGFAAGLVVGRRRGRRKSGPR